MSETPDDHLFVIVGGTGDLTRRKLLPALFHLAENEHLGKRWRVLALSRREQTDEDYRAWARDALADAGLDPDLTGRWCEECLHYASIGNDDWPAVADRIRRLEEDAGLPGHRTFYLAIPAESFGPTVEGLGEAGLASGPGWTRLVVEKPFGTDLESARELNEHIHHHFSEDQVYRIDHYLGKETVQNLVVLRFGNAIFEELWNRDRIESVTITVAEDLGVEKRAAFYEQTGALRDIVQNHLMQVLCLTAMEVPSRFDAEAVRFEKVKVLRSIRAPRRADVVFGQYGPGELDGANAPGYRQEEGVAPSSVTETFVAMKLFVDNWRWQGVPFYIRTGKRLPRKLTEIAVSFRRPPVCMFESMGSCLLHSNVLVVTLQPDEGFSLWLDVKVPGDPLTLRRLPLDFRYGEAFDRLPDAYQTLLLDVLLGDQTLFVHGDEVEAAWELLAPLLLERPPTHHYPAFSWGPREAAPFPDPDSYR